MTRIVGVQQKSSMRAGRRKHCRRPWVQCCWLLLLSLSSSFFVSVVHARPVVRNIQSSHEWDRLIDKHATETGLPVIVDFYSDSCGPCRMMAPIFKQLASSMMDDAVFVKVDTNAQYELSSRYQVRSLPTFIYFVNGKIHKREVGGIGRDGLKRDVDGAIRQAEIENVVLTLENLQTYYKQVDPSKGSADIETVHQKCVDMNKSKGKSGKGAADCVGAAANQLSRRLRQKYKKVPKTVPRFTAEDRQAKNNPRQENTGGSGGSSRSGSGSGGAASNKANLHLASKEELMAELESRLDQEREDAVEEEGEDEEEVDPDFAARWRGPDSAFPERVVILGGGPAGMSAAIYAARAGLKPVVICPSMGGQLQAKGVDVENYPALHNQTGPAVIALMRRQAGHFGAIFEDDIVVAIKHNNNQEDEDDDDTTSNNKRGSPSRLQVVLNATKTAVNTHSIIVATGAEANWLGVPGEYDLRGGGVSSCATCDGFLFKDKRVFVVGGGDAAMEDALVLARTSKSVTVIHRRDSFRASTILSDRVLDHPSISVVWNTTVQEILGKKVETTVQRNDDNDDDEEHMDLDEQQKEQQEEQQQVVSGVRVRDVATGDARVLEGDAVFVAIGHTPTTSFLKGVVDFDPDAPGYVRTLGQSTQTSVPGIFAAGDVADAVYRQAITSAGSGAAAALDAERYLSENGLGNEEADLEAELMAELLQDTSSFSRRTIIGQASDDDEDDTDTYNVYQDAAARVSGMKESFATEL